MIKKILFIAVILVLSICCYDCQALTLNTSYDLNSNDSTANRIVNYAINNGFNFYDHFIVIRDSQYSYYGFSFKDYSLNGNTVTLNDSNIYHYYRLGTSYNDPYLFNKSKDNVTLYLNNYSLGTIKDSNFIVASDDIKDYQYKSYLICLVVILIALLFFRCFRR